MPTIRRTPALLLASLVTVVAVAGCSSSGDSASGGSDSGGRSSAKVADVQAAVPEAAGPDAGALTADRLSTASVNDAGGAADAALNRSAPGQPAVISTGTVSLEAKDVAKARLGVRKVVDQFQGTVTEQETTTGDKGELSTARLVLRVPSKSFEDVVAAVEAVASPTGTTTNGEDVSAEVVDVDARLRSQRKSVERIQTLLARADSIEQIVAIEAQLASRQADLDALESRQKWLADQTSMSTLTVYVEQPAAASKHTEETADGFLGGLAQGWDAFADGARGVLVVTGFLVPWLILLAVIALPGVALVRRRRAGRAAATA